MKSEFSVGAVIGVDVACLIAFFVRIPRRVALYRFAEHVYNPPLRRGVRMRDFMKGGLFSLFICGMATCAMSAIAGVVIVLAESPLFSTRQFEMLFAMAMAFWTGMGTSALSAFAFAALDYVEQKFPATTRSRASIGSADD